MTYIVSPFWIYLLDKVGVIGKVLFIASIVLLFIGATKYWSHCDKHEYEEDMPKFKKKRFFILALVMFLMSVLMPSKQTLISMKVSEFVTEENINTGIDVIKETTDYIIEKIKE